MLAGMGTTAYDYSPGGQAQQNAWNLEIAQKFDGGVVALVYTPRVGDKGGANDNIDTADVKTGTATDVIFKGNGGVDGLSLLAAMSKTDGMGSASDVEVRQLGVAYNFGKFAVGATRADTDQSDATDDSQVEYGITYAVSDNFSVGLLHTTADNNSAESEKVNALQVGYNLGAVSVEAYYLALSSQAGSATAADLEKIGIRMGTKF